MSRHTRWQAIQTHPIFKSAYDKLNAAEAKLCVDFITENDSLSPSAFAEKLNRWYLDKPDKPKRLNAMWALLTETNPIDFKGRRS